MNPTIRDLGFCIALVKGTPYGTFELHLSVRTRRHRRRQLMDILVRAGQQVGVATRFRPRFRGLDIALSGRGIDLAPIAQAIQDLRLEGGLTVR